MNTPTAPLTAQQVFDKVLFALRAQGRAAVDSNNKCVYRAPNGDKCAFGHLIPDELYRPRMETLSARGVLGISNACDEVVINYRKYHNDEMTKLRQMFNSNIPDKLYSSLQSAHDSVLKSEGIEEWEKEMQRIAEHYELNYTAP